MNETSHRREPAFEVLRCSQDIIGGVETEVASEPLRRSPRSTLAADPPHRGIAPWPRRHRAKEEANVQEKEKMNGDHVRAIVTELREQNTLLREQLNGYFLPIMEITRLGAEAALLNHPIDIQVRMAKMRKIADAAIERLQGPQEPLAGGRSEWCRGNEAIRKLRRVPQLPIRSVLLGEAVCDENEPDRGPAVLGVGGPERALGGCRLGGHR
jgi:hypothetical protein